MSQQPEHNVRTYGRAVATLVLLDFLVTAAILITDKNLQTDFGAVHPYYLHWYGLLATGLVDLAGLIALYVAPSRRLTAAAAGWSIFMAIFLVADIATYGLVGFSTPTQFATYLFGLSHYNGALPYIPGLYDLLLLLYIITAALSAQLIRKMAR
ncbi:MAG: hypothetical protein QW429_05450 [Thermoprotei archaeon]